MQHRVSGADPVVLAGVPLAGTAAGGRAMHPAGGSCFHRAGQCSQPGCGAHRPCRQRQRAGSGRHPERYRVVLFRGGASAQNAVENQLARRGVQTVELVADLRTNPKTACTLEAERTLPAAEMAVNTAQKLRCTPALVEMLRTRNGCLVRLTVGNRQLPWSMEL